MEFSGIIIGILIATFFVVGVIAIILRAAVFSSAEGAVARLNDEIARTTAKQAELNEKLRIADEELTRTRAEAKELTDKMRTEVEESSKAERDKMIHAAREEAEQIIAKAHSAKDKLRVELEKEMDSKAIHFSLTILNKVLNEHVKGSFDEMLIDEFIESLNTVDMSKISNDIKEADIITLNALSEARKQKIAEIVKKKTERNMTVKTTTDSGLGGGMILKFGSMSLDGSLRNLIREAALKEQTTVDARTK